MNKKPVLILTIVVTIWTGATLVAPLLSVSTNSVIALSGSIIYFFMDPVCHQLPERSIFINQIPMPVCGRCFFIYLGGSVLLLTIVIRNKYIQWKNYHYIILGVAVTTEILLEKILSLGFTETRYLSGFLLGVLLFRLIAEAFNSPNYEEGKVDVG